MSDIPHQLSVIPVLVTGIQPPRVRVVRGPSPRPRVSRVADATLLDSCDKHRKDGGEYAFKSLSSAAGGWRLEAGGWRAI
jgi:hypothetical protein